MESTSTENVNPIDSIWKAVKQLTLHLLNRTHAEENRTSKDETIPNHCLLDYDDGQYPKTLFELGSTSWYTDIDAQKSGTWKDWFAVLRNMGFLSEVRHGGLFNELLPPRINPPMKNVYLVCGKCSMVIEGFNHWTVLSQGKIFHLKAGKDEPDNALHQTTLAEEFTSHTDFLKRLCQSVPGTPIYHRMDPIRDVSTPLPEKPVERKKELTRYIAYNVGKTSYTPEQINLLSLEIVRHMTALGTYGLFLNNCQHFAQTLVRRVVMVQREPKAVYGTLSEISAWDQGDKKYHLRKWLTKNKARFLFLPVRKSSTAPESLKNLTGSGWWRPTSLRGWQEYLESWVYEGEWGEFWEAIHRSDNALQELKNQFRERVRPYQGYAEYDVKTVPIIAITIAMALMLTAILELIGWTGFTHLATSAASSTTSIGPAPARLKNRWGTIFTFITAGSFGITGIFFVLYLVVTRALFARGSLSVKHYDIVTSRDWREIVSDLQRNPMGEIFAYVKNH